MKNKLLMLSIVTVYFFSLGFKRLVVASMYENGEVSRQIIIDKQVKVTHWENWEDNISMEKHAFVADEKVDYKITVKNSGEEELKNITVIDHLPDYIEFISSPREHSRRDKEIEWVIDKLDPGEEEEFTFKARVVDSDELAGKGDFCTTNHVDAEAETGEKDEDWAKICIEGPVLGVKELPVDGANLYLNVMLLLGVYFLGINLRRRSEKISNQAKSYVICKGRVI